MRFTRLAAVAALAFVAPIAGAQTAFIGSAGAFGTPAGTIDWASLGAPNSNPASGVTANSSISGLSATVSTQSGGQFTRWDNWNGSSGGPWFGNFDANVPVLWNGGNGTVSFIFSTAISSFGAQVQSNVYGAFTGSISAYDAANALLGTYSFAGNSNGNADNSAIFVGIQSDLTDIASIQLTAGNGDFATGNVSLDATTTPEPASLVLMGTGLAGIVIARRKRAKR